MILCLCISLFRKLLLLAPRYVCWLNSRNVNLNSLLVSFHKCCLLLSFNIVQSFSFQKLQAAEPKKAVRSKPAASKAESKSADANGTKKAASKAAKEPNTKPPADKKVFLSSFLLNYNGTKLCILKLFKLVCSESDFLCERIR